MLIIDGDYPMAFGGVDLDRDLTLPIEDVRGATDRRSIVDSWVDSETLASLPEMRKGGIAAALVKVVGRIRRPNSPIWGFRTGHGAYSAAQAHLAYYKILASSSEARILRSSGEFAAHIEEWEKTEDHDSLPVGFVIGMEGADPILWPEQVREWWDSGLRVISLSHYGVSTYSHGTGTGTQGGLFPPARKLLHEMDALGMILDVTHTSDQSVREALEIQRERCGPERGGMNIDLGKWVKTTFWLPFFKNLRITTSNKENRVTSDNRAPDNATTSGRQDNDEQTRHQSNERSSDDNT